MTFTSRMKTARTGSSFTKFGMTDYNEKEVLARLADEKLRKNAFSQLVAHYSEQLYWQIRRIVLDHEDANDLLQNTFVKAWMNIGYFRGDAKISTWLYRIALNECLTFMAAKKDLVPLDGETAAATATLEADEYFNGDEIQLHLQKALQTLPVKQRMVFNMRYYNEMKYEEMSEVFGTSVGALKTSYHLAVKKIEKYLKSKVE